MAMYKSINDIPESEYLETLVNELPDEDEADEDDGLDYPADEDEEQVCGNNGEGC